MPIKAAFAVPHPPLIVPQVGRGGEKQIEATVRAYEQAADEIAALRPDTIIISSPHSVMYADWFHVSPGSGASGSFAGFAFLDFFDFVTNSVLMPVVAASTCVFIGWVATPKTVEDEVEACGRAFRLKGLYRFLVRYFAPALVVLILVQQVCAVCGLKAWVI